MESEELYDATQKLIAEKDLFAASEFVFSLGEESEIVSAFSGLLFNTYYKAKSIRQVLHLGCAGINYCLSRAGELDPNSQESKDLRLSAKKMATNIASFTWPGWDEPGIEISAEEMRQGLAFARYSIRQLNDLDPTDDQLSFSYWFLGAQLLAHKKYDEALEIFTQAHRYGPDGKGDSSAMLTGYIGLTKILNDQDGEEEFAAAILRLESIGTEDAKFYAEQLQSVRSVFENKL
jgi:hypothetical protein|tara:strand:- start:74 stop:775 length:702 start_codon:yes stop_codon:yes gene_type:complete